MDKKSKKKVVTKKGVSKPHSYKGKVRQFKLGEGLPTVAEVQKEFDEYREVLFGRKDPPLDRGVMTLMEVAEGYFSRACEIEQLIFRAVRDGEIPKNHPLNALRTQEIRSFKEMAKSATELGSRRITWENIRHQQETRGLESM